MKATTLFAWQTGILICSLGAGAVLLLKTDPYHSSSSALVAFYFLVFLFIYALSSLAGYAVRLLLWRRGTKYDFIRAANRQGVYYGLLTVAVLVLQAASLFSVWTAVLLVVVFTLIELYTQ